ncbi:hypothetical protein J6590_004224 [Homalodisca vitripennis]|nr:hypothetical protein J6590_004224 [Homalodisca vitripennis]
MTRRAPLCRKKDRERQWRGNNKASAVFLSGSRLDESADTVQGVEVEICRHKQSILVDDITTPTQGRALYRCLFGQPNTDELRSNQAVCICVVLFDTTNKAAIPGVYITTPTQDRDLYRNIFGQPNTDDLRSNQAVCICVVLFDTTNKAAISGVYITTPTQDRDLYRNIFGQPNTDDLRSNQAVCICVVLFDTTNKAAIPGDYITTPTQGRDLYRGFFQPTKHRRTEIKPNSLCLCSLARHNKQSSYIRRLYYHTNTRPRLMFSTNTAFIIYVTRLHTVSTVDCGLPAVQRSEKVPDTPMWAVWCLSVCLSTSRPPQLSPLPSWTTDVHIDQY